MTDVTRYKVVKRFETYGIYDTRREKDVKWDAKHYIRGTQGMLLGILHELNTEQRLNHGELGTEFVANEVQ